MSEIRGTKLVALGDLNLLLAEIVAKISVKTLKNGTIGLFLFSKCIFAPALELKKIPCFAVFWRCFVQLIFFGVGVCGALFPFEPFGLRGLWILGLRVITHNETMGVTTAGEEASGSISPCDIEVPDAGDSFSFSSSNPRTKLIFVKAMGRENTFLCCFFSVVFLRRGRGEGCDRELLSFAPHPYPWALTACGITDRPRCGGRTCCSALPRALRRFLASASGLMNHCSHINSGSKMSSS